MRSFHLPGRSPVLATNGMCATSHPLAARTAVRILEDGGNAMDAALAAAFLLGICEPHMTGIGGDCFALIKPPGDERIVALNGSGRAPARLSADDLRAAGHKKMPLSNPDSVTIPGAVDAFCRLSEDWGLLGIETCLAPAIRYAEEGVPVAQRTAHDWAASAGTLQGAARDHFLANGEAPKEGQIFRHPGMAEAFRLIAEKGRAGFYEGPVAEDMVATLRALGGCHTLEDFAAARSEYTVPVSGEYRGIELVEHPPNGQGATAILLAGILQSFDLGSLEPFGADRAHLEAEATKLAFDARDRFIADPQHTERLEHMIAPETADRLAALIDPKRAMADPRRTSEAVHRETVYLTVVDRDLMAVSLIYSIFHSFGSGIASPKYGILFQNRGAGFSLEKGHPNEAGGGKRPMHTIIPAMLRKAGRVVCPFGVMGGAYQPTGHLRFLSNVVDYGLDLQAAIDGPRCFATDGLLQMEEGYSDAVLADLAARGHEVRRRADPLGGAQAIWIDHARGTLIGASDPRKDGLALGY